MSADVLPFSKKRKPQVRPIELSQYLGLSQEGREAFFPGVTRLISATRKSLGVALLTSMLVLPGAGETYKVNPNLHEDSPWQALLDLKNSDDPFRIDESRSYYSTNLSNKILIHDTADNSLVLAQIDERGNVTSILQSERFALSKRNPS